MTTLQDKMAKLPAARRLRVEARAKDLIAEEMSLRQLREAHRKTQAALARQLGITQDGVSRLERRSDMLISTLRSYVAELGGSMKLVVAFKDQPNVEIHDLGMLTKPARRSASGRKRMPQSGD